MSGQIYKTSRAQIISEQAIPAIVRMLEYENPEAVLSNALKEYMLDVGFSSAYPAFGNIRISSVHPFALLLFADVTGKKLDTNVFPSITISDSSDNQSFHELGRETAEVVITKEDFVKIKGYAEAGELFVSDEGLSALEAATDNGNTVSGVRVGYRSAHSFDFNIWTENKDITSFIFDLVKMFLVENAESLHEKGIDFQGDITGRRSGDINLEFGKILYGANVRAGGVIHQSALIAELPFGRIEHIDANTLPEFHFKGEG